MSESSSSDGEDTWIQWFCGLQGHEMFCEVDRSYIEDGFNLYGLRHWVPNINESLDVILDRVGHTDASSELLEATYALYGLIHARYVLTTSGLEAMYAKYILQEFGNCPHFLCRRQPVVPVGVRDEPQMETVKLYCPKCQDVYVHPSHAAQRVDGAYFGTTFPHLFFMTYGSMLPDPLEQKFVPRVFGFRLHRSAVNGAYARGQGASQQHNRDLDQRRQPPRVPGSTAGGDGPSGAMTLARASEATVLPVRRGSQKMGVAGSGGAPPRKKTVVGEAGELVEAGAEDELREEEERARKGAPSKGDETRAAGRSSPPPGEVREKDKGKDKQQMVDGGKGTGTGGTLRGRGGAENGRTSSSVRESRSATSTRSRGRTSPTEGPQGQGDDWTKDVGGKVEITGRDRSGKPPMERDAQEGSSGQPRCATGRSGSNRRVGQARDAGEATLMEEDGIFCGLASTTTEGNGNGARKQLRGQDSDAARGRSSNGARIPYDEGSRGPRSGSAIMGSRSASIGQERGRKRLLEGDLDAAELADDAAGRVGGGAGDGAGRGGGGGGGGAGAGGGGGGKGRGKAARSDRNVTSARAAATAPAASTPAVDGGPSTRRTRGGLG